VSQFRDNLLSASFVFGVNTVTGFFITAIVNNLCLNEKAFFRDPIFVLVQF